MKNKFLSYLASLTCVLLTACAAPQPTPPATAPEPVPVVCDPPVVTMPVPSAADEMLAYHDGLLRLPQAELIREFDSLVLQPASPRRAMQQAMVLGLLKGNGDFARARVHLDSVLQSTDPQARELKPLAQLLAANYAASRRLVEQVEKLNQQARENHRRVEQLNQMLEGLKAIERTLPARPSGVSAVVPVEAK